uniref:CRISPR system Cms protein Csm5 n=1 Tax=Pseudothermotoga hypogea TaxID=57487 RepID=A0A832ID78_9THEM
MSFSSVIELTPISPVFIGCDEKIERFETVVEGNTVYVLDFEKLLSDEHFVELFVERRKDILDVRTKDSAIKDILKSLNLKLSDVSLVSFPALRKPNGEVVNLQMRRFVRTAGRHYVPGSSIKGAFRTALIKSNENLMRSFENELNEFLRRSEPGQERAQGRQRQDPNFEGKIFGTPQESLFRLIRFSDSEFIDRKFIGFRLVYSMSLANKRTKIPTMLELWLPSRENSNKVRALYQVKLDGFERNVNNVANLLDMLRSKERLIETMKKANRKIINLELERLKNAVKTEYTQRLSAFYNELQRMNEQIKDGFLLRLGAGGGFYSKTIFIRLLNDREKQFLSKFYKRVNPNVFPASIVVSQVQVDHLSSVPLGWIKVRFVS